MRVKRYIILLVCLLTCVGTFGQEVQKAPLSVTDGGEGVLKLHFQLSGVGLMVVGRNFTQLTCSSLSLGTGRVGCPDLPTACMLVRLPKGNVLTVSGVDAKETVVEDFVPTDMPLAPVMKAWVKDQDWPGYEPDRKIYETNEFYRGGEKLEVEHLGRLGEEEVYRLTVRPIAYNPVSGGVRFCEMLEGELRVSPNTLTSLGEENDKLLIVSRSEFRDGLQPFVLWKRQEGYDVEELYVTTYQRDAVKEQIRPYFDNADAVTPAPGYLLLVGDAAQIQSFIGETSLESVTHITDLYYAEFSGDYLPDALLGRWPVNDTAELRVVVEKTLRYEQFRDMDTLQLKRMLLVAGKENGSPAPLTTNSQVDYLKREIKQAHPEVDTLCYYNPRSGNQLDTIVGDIGRGAGLLNYTAHCTVAGWSSPTLTISRVEEAQGSQPMVYVNNCCKSNIFSGTGFGEQLLRLPVGGGVGVIGATNSTLWNEDYYWAVGPKIPIVAHAAYDPATRGAFDALAGGEPSVTTLGEMLAAGNLAVSASGSPYGRFYWEIYCLLGDPTLMPYVGIPRSVTLSLSDSLYNGQSTVYVNGTPGARVTVVQDSLLLGVTVIDSGGQALIPLRRTLEPRQVLLTATGSGLQPRVDTLTVSTDIEFGVAVRDVSVDDSTVTCLVENVGCQRIDSLMVVLTQLGEDTLSGTLLTEEVVVIDSLSVGGQQGVTLPVNVYAVGRLPMWQATLLAWKDGEGSLCDLALRHSMPVVYPTMDLHLLDAQGREARRLQPGREYQLAATVTGPEGLLTLEAEALPAQGPWATTHDDRLAFITPDSLCGLRIAGRLQWERWSDEQSYWLEPGSLVDGFENGLEAHPWNNDSRHPWTLDNEEYHSGSFSLRSGAIDHSQSTSLCIEVLLPHSDTVSYWVKTSTEEQYDKLSFSIDGYSQIPAAWGVTNWNQRVHLLQPGRHRLCWSYSKDVSTSAGSDCVWIDDVRLPLSFWDTVYDWNCLTSHVGIAEVVGTLVHIYPNPSSGQVWITGTEVGEVHVTDLMGRTVATLRMEHAPVLWDASALPSGVYYAVCRMGNHFSTHKIILRKD